MGHGFVSVVSEFEQAGFANHLGAGNHLFAGEAQEFMDSERERAHRVILKHGPVAVTRGHLQHRLD
jgi:hypothetical protein